MSQNRPNLTFQHPRQGDEDDEDYYQQPSMHSQQQQQFSTGSIRVVPRGQNPNYNYQSNTNNIMFDKTSNQMMSSHVPRNNRTNDNMYSSQQENPMSQSRRTTNNPMRTTQGMSSRGRQGPNRPPISQFPTQKKQFPQDEYFTSPIHNSTLPTSARHSQGSSGNIRQLNHSQNYNSTQTSFDENRPSGRQNHMQKQPMINFQSTKFNDDDEVAPTHPSNKPQGIRRQMQPPARRGRQGNFLQQQIPNVDYSHYENQNERRNENFNEKYSSQDTQHKTDNRNMRETYERPKNYATQREYNNYQSSGERGNRGRRIRGSRGSRGFRLGGRPREFQTQNYNNEITFNSQNQSEERMPRQRIRGRERTDEVRRRIARSNNFQYTENIRYPRLQRSNQQQRERTTNRMTSGYPRRSNNRQRGLGIQVSGPYSTNTRQNVRKQQQRFSQRRQLKQTTEEDYSKDNDVKNENTQSRFRKKNEVINEDPTQSNVQATHQWQKKNQSNANDDEKSKIWQKKEDSELLKQEEIRKIVESIVTKKQFVDGIEEDRLQDLLKEAFYKRAIRNIRKDIVKSNEKASSGSYHDNNAHYRKVDRVNQHQTVNAEQLAQTNANQVMQFIRFGFLQNMFDVQLPDNYGKRVYRFRSQETKEHGDENDGELDDMAEKLNAFVGDQFLREDIERMFYGHRLLHSFIDEIENDVFKDMFEKTLDSKQKIVFLKKKK